MAEACGRQGPLPLWGEGADEGHRPREVRCPGPAPPVLLTAAATDLWPLRVNAFVSALKK